MVGWVGGPYNKTVEEMEQNKNEKQVYNPLGYWVHALFQTNKKINCQNQKEDPRRRRRGKDRFKVYKKFSSRVLVKPPRKFKPISPLQQPFRPILSDKRPVTSSFRAMCKQ